MRTIDLKTNYKALYGATARAVQLVTVPPRPYLMFDGKGDPNTSDDFQTGVPALFSIAYGLRAAIKAATGAAYTVMPLEGLWSVGDGGSYDDRSTWVWTLLLMQPDAVDEALFIDTLKQVKRKKPNPALGSVRLEQLEEGTCAQMLHVGPFSTERQTFARIEAYCAANGYVRTKEHHEIYLSNLQRTPPEKLKTILRVRVAHVSA